MKKIILLQICLYSFVVSQAQNEFHYFNKTYGPDINLSNNLPAISNGSVAIKNNNDSYMVFGAMANDVHGELTITNVNDLGFVNWIALIDTGIAFRSLSFGNSLERTLDNNFVATAIRGVDELNTNYLLIKFSSTGEVLWSKEYAHAGMENHAQVVVCEEGGYLLVGVTVTGNSYQTYLIRTDDFGEVMWEREIGDVAIPLYAEQTQDNGFIISGYHYNTTTGYDMYVLKTDAEGIVEWENTYGTDESDGGSAVIQLANGNYALIGRIDNGSDTKSGLYFANLNAMGEVILDKTYFGSNKIYGHAGIPHLKANGEIVIATLHYGAPAFTWEVALTFLSAEGEILSEKPLSSGLGGEDYIRDLEPTADGGYILSGFNLTSPQRSWVVKTDEFGNTCGLAPCDSTIIQLIDTGTYINNTKDKAFPFSIRPNPVIDRCFIDYELSAKYPFSVLELYNLKGEKVHHTLLSSHETTAQMDIAHLTSGIYLYKVSDIDGVLASGKLVKE